MKKLHDTWLTEGLIDFEYKKYLLLAYLQHVEGQFRQARLYPYLKELEVHLQTCQTLKGKKAAIQSAFPRRVQGIDLQAMEIIYEEMVEENPKLADIGYLLDYAIPQMRDALHRGEDVLEEVGESVTLSPVGIVPMRTEEGYLFLQRNRNKVIYVYQYQLALFTNEHERYVKLKYVDREGMGITSTVAQLKISLTRRFRHLPNPATYIVESPVDYPLGETLLPVAQGLLLRHLSMT